MKTFFQQLFNDMFFNLPFVSRVALKFICNQNVIFRSKFQFKLSLNLFNLCIFCYFTTVIFNVTFISIKLFFTFTKCYFSLKCLLYVEHNFSTYFIFSELFTIEPIVHYFYKVLIPYRYNVLFTHANHFMLL